MIDEGLLLPLANVRVLELTRTLSGAYCGKQFASWGADVAVVGGPECPVHEWEFLAANKRIAAHESPGQLAEAVAASDVLITDLLPGKFREACGTDLASADQAFPSTVIVSITPFGLSGPYANTEATDLTVAAASGFMSLNGTPDGPPLSAPGHVLEYTIGANAFVAALAALNRQGATSRGTLVEVASAEAAASLVPFLRTEYSGQRLKRSGGPGGTMVFRCRDGFVTLNAGADRSWPGVLVALGIDEDDVPESLKSAKGRANQEELRRFLQPHIERRDALDLFHALSDVRVVVGIFRQPRELVDNVQLRARGAFSFVESAALGPVCLPGPGALTEGFRPAPPRAAPVRNSIATPAWPPRSRNLESPPQPQRPLLEGVRVLDLTHAWIGPHATQLLADLGADVVKVESLAHPDVWRLGAGPTANIPALAAAHASAHPWNLSPLFNATNTNKRSIVLELDRPEGRDLFLRLVQRFDLVVENFTPRVLENLGLGFDELKRANSRIALVSASGFGATGPWRDYRANGATTEANAGWDALFGGDTDSPPLMMGAMQADAICGVQVAAFCLLALRACAATGAAHRVDASMFEMAVNLIGEELVRESVAASLPVSAGRASVGLKGVFRTAGEDDWIALEIRNERDWSALVSALEDPALDQPAFRTFSRRLVGGDEVRSRLAGALSLHDAEELVGRLQRSNIPAARVLATDEVLSDRHFKQRAWFRTLSHPEAGSHRYNGTPWRIHGVLSKPSIAPPCIGEHSREVLSQELGVTENQYAEFVTAGITGALISNTKGEAIP